MKRGVLFVFSGPSGSGKTTLAKQIVEQVGNMNFVISYTTRPKRKGELNGKDYFFINIQKFKNMIENNEFAEWAEVFGNYYGTPMETVKTLLNEGKDVLLEIDVKGARQIREKFSDSIHVFILAPTIKELGQRLVKRKTDSSDEIKNRLNLADKEMAEAKGYDYTIINDELKQSLVKIEKIIQIEKTNNNFL